MTMTGGGTPALTRRCTSKLTQILLKRKKNGFKMDNLFDWYKTIRG